MALVNCIESELNEVKSQIAKETQFKSSSLEELLEYEMNGLDRHLFPAIVLTIGKITEDNREVNISLASIFQYIFLAHSIHRLVDKEDVKASTRQYSVLIGDFLFGQTFYKICDESLYKYAWEFVKVIETINEGVIMRWRLKDKTMSAKDYSIIISKERAALTRLAGRLAAKVAGLKEPYQQRIEDFCYSIGMAWAAWEENIYTSIVHEYLINAKRYLDELKDSLPIRPLQEFFYFFCQGINQDIKGEELLLNIK